jgi:hypothetical protein
VPGNEQHGNQSHAGRAAQGFEKADAVQVGHHDVRRNHIRAHSQKLSERVYAVCGGFDAKLIRQRLRQVFANRPIIIDEQNLGTRFVTH